MNLLRKFLEKELNIPPDDFTGKFIEYEKYLLEWNQKINLMSRKTTSIETHILNSVFFLKKYDIPRNSKIADVGTGGGFPGIPLKILRDDLQITLIDSIGKKINAVEDITRKMNLTNIDSVTSRVEDLTKQKQFYKTYDLVISKSVGTIDNLWDWGKNLLKPEGEMICIKGGDLSEEILSLEKKFRHIDYRIIEYEFDTVYVIEDKKAVIIKKSQQIL